MFPTLSRNRSRQPCSVLVLGALVVGSIASAAYAEDISTAATFAGAWKYKQTCGFHHSATVILTQTGESVTGDWTDGTRLNGSDGSLKGNIRDGKLYVRYCGGDAHAGYAVCPRYESKENDYFVRQGNDLVWYRRTSNKEENSFEKYIVLHRVMKGELLPVDDKCTDDQN